MEPRDTRPIKLPVGENQGFLNEGTRGTSKVLTKKKKWSILTDLQTRP